jgi:hypothetical protein
MYIDKKLEEYILQTIKCSDIRESDTIIQVDIKIAAYMDDTTLISYCKENLQLMMNICDNFYQLNDIQINPNKSELIVINNNNPEEPSTIQTTSGTITALTKHQPIRMLGVWHNGN